MEKLANPSRSKQWSQWGNMLAALEQQVNPWVNILMQWGIKIPDLANILESVG